MALTFAERVYNDNAQPGVLALPKQFFGRNSRYAMAPVHTRHGHVAWFIWDAEEPEPMTGLPEVLFQGESLDDALYYAQQLEETEAESQKLQESFTLSIRKTQTYVDSYRHLDQEDPVATAVVLQTSSQITDEEDMCQPTRIVKLIQITDHVKGSYGCIEQAIRDTMSHRGCGHEYDCCGCWSHSVSEVLRLKHDNMQFIVIQHASRNY
jgi:hypothetical protein